MCEMIGLRAYLLLGFYLFCSETCLSESEKVFLIHLKKFQTQKVKIVGGETPVNHSRIFACTPHFTFYIFFKTIRTSLKITTETVKTLLIGQLCSQKHREMFCGGRTIIFKNSRKNLEWFCFFFVDLNSTSRMAGSHIKDGWEPYKGHPH